MTISDLQRRFGVPGVVKIDEGRGSLPRMAVTSDLASAEIYFHGAHLTAFQPRGARPVLFMSAESHFDAAKPIRGGIPVIFPWFGPRVGSPDSPAHGIARVHAWELESCTLLSDGAVHIAFILASDEDTLRLWPHSFGLRLIFTIGRSLKIEMEVRGEGAPFMFEEAFHTYLLVGDVRQVSVDGLENTEYIDKVDSFQRKNQAPAAVRISGETDRVYLDTRSTCVVRDPVLERTLLVEKENSSSTVLWNPWIQKARAMPDFGDEEWPSMICVETANVGDGAVRLEAAQMHRMRAHIKIGG
ncbi:MAG TPA: D-hexose-6-phosphate mutarotase [Planctomycetota bacterium]|jgi:glucose-6-phosphate 1-epimerase|nr:D-hexose-6-phosphate mutarotase [Planctomycetota bacterium]